MSDRLAVGVIGAGRVGPVLASALAGVGHSLVGITSGSDQDRLAAILPGLPTLSADDLVKQSELVILAVPDAELPGLVTGLAEVGAWRPGQLVLHTSPAFGIEVLEPAQRAGAIALAVHPALSFSGTSVDLRQLAGAYAGVAAQPGAMPIAQALAVELGCEPVIVDAADRAAYAEAVATASDFSKAILSQATSLLKGIGFENPGGFLHQLVHSSVDRALQGDRFDPFKDLEQ